MSSDHPDNRVFDNRVFDFQDQNTGFDAELEEARNRRHRGGCCSCGCCLGCLSLLLLFVFCIAVIFYAMVDGGVPLVVSEETTIITEPLKSDGETVDFHQAIQTMIEPNVQPDENAFMAIWQGYSREILDSIDREDARRQYLGMSQQFGVDPMEPATWVLPRWTPATTERWLTEVEEGLNAVQSAAAQPHYFVPLTRQNEDDFVVMSQPLAIYAFHERLSDALRLRADIRFLADSDVDGAWKDIFTSIRLFRLVTIYQAWTLELRGRDSESLLTPVFKVVAMLPQWTPEQLEQAIEDLETLPDWTDRQTMLRKLQFMFLDLLSATNDFPGLSNRLGREMPGDLRDLLETFQYISFDWSLTARQLNRMIKTYEELLEKVEGSSLETQFDLLYLRPPGESSPVWDNAKWNQFVLDYMQGIDNPWSLMPFVASGRSQLLGLFGSFFVTQTAGEMYRLQLIEDSHIQALRWALALERFRRAEGHYPDSLDALGLRPMMPDMHLQYEKRGDGYRIQNKVVQLSVE